MEKNREKFDLLFKGWQHYAFQCESCGCCENSTLAPIWFDSITECFDWSGIEDRKGKRLCSACGPSRYADGKPSRYGVWHGRFTRTFIPLGEFHTNQKGNLEHTATGSEDFYDFAIEPPKGGGK